MRTSPEGLALIRTFEGCVLKAYKCPAGVWTIGYGHTRGVGPGQKITDQEAIRLLDEDVRLIENRLNSKFPGQLEQRQFDALVSFIFNLGWTKFSKSTLCHRIENRASDGLVCEQLLRWVFVGKRRTVGLMKRRVAEANLWIGRRAYQVVIKNNIAGIVAV